MLENIKVLNHSSIKFDQDLIIYFDPFKIDFTYNDADIVFITHDHYDHYSEEDINKIKKDNTIYIVPESLVSKLKDIKIKDDNIISVIPNQEYTINNIKFNTIPAYNISKQFHPRENNWVGYIVNINNINYYVAGDTDMTEDNMKVKCDIAFIPVGGKFTMDYKEAATLVNKIKPQIAIPIHYGSIIGTEEDADNFIKLLDSHIEGKKLM